MGRWWWGLLVILRKGLPESAACAWGRGGLMWAAADAPAPRWTWPFAPPTHWLQTGPRWEPQCVATAHSQACECGNWGRWQQRINSCFHSLPLPTGCILNGTPTLFLTLLQTDPRLACSFWKVLWNGESKAEIFFSLSADYKNIVERFWVENLEEKTDQKKTVFKNFKQRSLSFIFQLQFTFNIIMC